MLQHFCVRGGGAGRNIGSDVQEDGVDGHGAALEGLDEPQNHGVIQRAHDGRELRVVLLAQTSVQFLNTADWGDFCIMT